VNSHKVDVVIADAEHENPALSTRQEA